METLSVLPKITVKHMISHYTKILLETIYLIALRRKPTVVIKVYLLFIKIVKHQRKNLRAKN